MLNSTIFTRNDGNNQSKVFVATEITLSATGNPAGIPTDLRAATEIRMSKSYAHHSTNDIKEKKKPLPHSGQRGGPKRLISSADKTMPTLTCGWIWLSSYQEGPLRNRWEEPGFECWAKNGRDHLQPVAEHPPSPPERSPFPCPPVGRLIILSLR